MTDARALTDAEAAFDEGDCAGAFGILRRHMSTLDARLRQVEALVAEGPHWSPHPDVRHRVPVDREWGTSLIAVADVRAALAPEQSEQAGCGDPEHPGGAYCANTTGLDRCRWVRFDDEAPASSIRPSPPRRPSRRRP